MSAQSSEVAWEFSALGWRTVKWYECRAPRAGAGIARIWAGQGLLSGLKKMNDPRENPRRYRWPWAVAAAVALGIVLAIIWVGLAVKKVERERDQNAPLPKSAPLNPSPHGSRPPSPQAGAPISGGRQ